MRCIVRNKYEYTNGSGTGRLRFTTRDPPAARRSSLPVNRRSQFTRWFTVCYAYLLNLPVEFGQTRISAIQPADLENPTVEPNMKWIGRPLSEIWPFEFFPNVRSSVVGHSYTDLIYSSSLRNAQYTPPTPTRRNYFVASRRRRRCVHEFATTADGFGDANAQRSRRP